MPPMINANMEERVVLDGDAAAVLDFIRTVPVDLVRTAWVGEHGGQLSARMISPQGSLARLVETPEAFELRVLDDRGLAAALAALADARFGAQAQIA